MAYNVPTYIFKRAIVLVLLALVFWSCGSGDSELEEVYLPAGMPLVVDITGDDYYWRIRYPGRDGQLYSADDITKIKLLYLPEHTKIRIQLHSADYIYTFVVPELALNQVAIPELEFSLEFETGAADTLSLRGKQLCGFIHKSLQGQIFVESRKAFANRLEHQQISATPSVVQ